jgi:hypothetical protein
MAVVDGSVVRWLLEAKTPSIRYFTLRDLLHKPETDVQAERQAMAADGPIPQILALQTETGQWANEYSYYTPKYRSTHWSMMLLTELGIDPADERFQRGIDFMLSASQPQQEEHVNGSAYGLLCLWGNLLRYTAYGKQLDDPRALRLMVCIQQPNRRLGGVLITAVCRVCGSYLVGAATGKAGSGGQCHDTERAGNAA